jgi:3',5'-cyclic AMP phosphodiesterase CpdA
VTLSAVSDLHVRHRDNRAIVEGLRPGSADDWLIVAGDVGERVDDVAWALGLLRERFARVVWVPGNHELWTRTKDPAPLRGEARYRHLVETCTVGPPARQILDSVLAMVGGDAQQPAGKGHASPFESVNAGKRFVEDLRGQVLGRITIADAPCDVSVHAREIQLIQFGKAAGVLFGGFDQQAVVSLG